MKRFTSILLVSVMILAMALTMIACGGSDVTTTAATTTAVTTTTAATTTKKQGPGIVIPKDYDGDGTQESPYLIDDAQSLLAMAKNAKTAGGFSGKYFKMTANIDMDGQQWTPMTVFNGNFDGDGYAIINLTVSGTAVRYTEAAAKLGGFCGEFAGVIQNVAFINLDVTAKVAVGSETHAGMIVGKCMAGATFKNVYVHGFGTGVGVEGGAAGGLRFGTIAGYMDTSPVFENVACAVTITGVGSIYRLAGAGGVFTVTDTYIILGEDSVTANGWISAFAFRKNDGESEAYTTNFYCTGATGDSMIYGGTGQAMYKDVCTAGFYEGKGTITSADFYGDALGFNSENWNTYADGAPIQKVFEGKCDDYLKQVAK